MQSVALRVSCLGPVLRLGSSEGRRPAPLPPVPGFGSSAPLRAGPCIRGGPAPGGRGGLCAAPPGGVAGRPRGAGDCLTLVRPSALPRLATKRVSLPSFSSWRVWPPYCSGLCPCADPGCGPRGALLRRCGSACLSWPLWELVGSGMGARGVRA